ncbi:hypothetical protein BHM03_00053565 [Ensete ventricosum]|nr:hypothetical protein BHM03_00053565 [Ensete ventricosum]
MTKLQQGPPTRGSACGQPAGAALNYRCNDVGRRGGRPFAVQLSVAAIRGGQRIGIHGKGRGQPLAGRLLVKVASHDEAAARTARKG